MAFEPLQLIAGGALFLFAAYSLQRALLGKDAEWPERLAIGVALALLLPGLVLLLLNLGLRVPFNALTVYAAYIVIGVIAFTSGKWAPLVPLPKWLPKKR